MEAMLVLPFDATVDVLGLTPSAHRVFLKSYSKGSLARIPLAAKAWLMGCVESVQDNTFQISNIRLLFNTRERTVDVKKDKCILELASISHTEQQSAGVFLYGDVYASLISVPGVKIHAPTIEIGRACMCYFASLLNDATSKDVYINRKMELGSPGDKLCVACWAVGDFKECTKCNLGIYTCSPGCFISCHFDLCSEIVKLPVERRTREVIASFHLSQTIQLLDVNEPQIIKAFSKPMVSRICAVCGVYGTLKCGTCKKIYYCSKECQTLAFPAHKRMYH
jgi:hypothetical protein